MNICNKISNFTKISCIMIRKKKKVHIVVRWPILQDSIVFCEKVNFWDKMSNLTKITKITKELFLNLFCERLETDKIVTFKVRIEFFVIKYQLFAVIKLIISIFYPKITIVFCFFCFDKYLSILLQMFVFASWLSLHALADQIKQSVGPDLAHGPRIWHQCPAVYNVIN